MMKNLSINQNRCRNSTDDKITRKGYLNSYNCIPYVQEARRNMEHIKYIKKVQCVKKYTGQDNQPIVHQREKNSWT